MASPRVNTSGKLSTATTHVSFVCQKCRQPLKLDQTFNALDQSTIAELSTPLTSENKDTIMLPFQELTLENYEEDPNITRHKVLPARSDFEVSCDFTLLGETGCMSIGNLGHRLKVSSVLFDFLSGQSEVDHPLCEDCTDTLLDKLDLQLKQTEDECNDYKDFLVKLNCAQDSEEESVLDKELEQLRGEEEKLLQELARVEKEQEMLEVVITQEKERATQLEESEAQYYRDYSELKCQRMDLEDDHLSVENQMHFATAQLNKLKQVNIFNSTFHIWHDGQFGTINGFRLGRLPNCPVEWSEINAAWGQAALLLHSMARRVNLTFTRYRLVPYGSYSYIENLDYDLKKKSSEKGDKKSKGQESKEYNLYGSGGFKFFWDTKFDMGMAAYLNCLEQLWDKISDGNQLPYLIKGDKLEDQKNSNIFSIKTQFNVEEQWTKALKFMLTDLKWCLSIIQAQGAKSLMNN